MALGGLKYGGSILLGTETYSEVLELADYNTLIGFLHSLDGWSEHTALTHYVGSGSFNGLFYKTFYAISAHTSGSRFVWVIGNCSSSTYIHSTNSVTNASIIGSAGLNYHMSFAYIPPGIADPNPGDNPNTSGWLPAGSLKFQGIAGVTDNLFFYTYPTLTTLPSYGEWRFHVVARGDTVAVLAEGTIQKWEGIHNMYLAGELLDVTANPTDTYKYASIGWAYYNSSAPGDMRTNTLYVQSHTAAGATISNFTGGLTFTALNSYSLGASVNDRPPYNWDRIFMYLSNSDLDTYGIVPGNGVKGSINPEILRYMRVGVAASKQTLASGNLIYLNNGYVLGWDPLNGAMT